MSQLSDFVQYSADKVKSNDISIENYVTTDCLLQNRLGRVIADKLPPNTCQLTAYYDNDILIGNIRPYLKKIWFADSRGGNSADVLTLQVNKKHDPKFVYYALSRDSFFIHMMKGSKGSKMPRGDKGQILRYELPNFNKQQEIQIAKVLSFFDDKIELNNKIKSELETVAKLLYDYWFVQFNFPDKNGKPYKSSGGKMVYNDELKREIPEGWKVKALCQLTDWSTESLNPFDMPTKLFRHYSIPIFDKNGTYSEELGANILSNKFIIKETDILVSKLNPRTNRVIWAQNINDQICSTEFVVWRTQNDNIKGFLYVTAKSFSFINYCIQSASGTSHSHNRIAPDIMMKYPQAYNLDIVEKYGETINSLINRYSETTKQNEELIKLRDWLLPILMNGQVKVK